MSIPWNEASPAFAAERGTLFTVESTATECPGTFEALVFNVSANPPSLGLTILPESGEPFSRVVDMTESRTMIDDKALPETGLWAVSLLRDGRTLSFTKRRSEESS